MSPQGLIVCDIDNTLTGSREGVAALKAWLEQHGDMRFAIATGRSLQSAVDVLKEWGIPGPSILITSVGTQIHYSPEGRLETFERDADWTRRWQENWQRDAIAARLSEFAWLEPQAGSEQSAGKISYYLEDESRVVEVQKALDAHGLAAELVYSHGRYLDILPPESSKGHAVAFVANKLGVPLDEVIAAGDSGNDIDMLQMAGQSIAVGNASEELIDELDPDDAYFAKKDYAAGVVEGLEQYEEAEEG